MDKLTRNVCLRDRADGRKKYRRVGLTRFIPTIVLESLDINLEGNSWEPLKEAVGHLVETNTNGMDTKKPTTKKTFLVGILEEQWLL